jgi:hypothetical protein
LYSQLRHRIKVERKDSVPGPLGPTEEWVTVAEFWGGFAEVSLEGRTQFQQIGHSSVAGKLVFRGPLGFNLDMANHRFVYKGEYYEAVEPPSNPDSINRFVTIVVKKLPQQP